jgi:hypothetical protein
VSARQPHTGDRVHWNCKPPTAGLFGTVLEVDRTTMHVRWDSGQISRHLPTRVMQERRWSYEDELAVPLAA